MKANKFILVFVLISITGCINNHYNAENQKRINSFNIFIEKFDKDSIFRKKHISDSLEILIVDLDDDKLKIKKIEDKINLPAFQQNKYEQEDGYKWKISYKKDTVLYVQQGIDNGIYITYMFIKRHKTWYLSKIIDESE